MESPASPARKTWLPSPWREAMAGLKPLPALFGFTGRLSRRQFYIMMPFVGLGFAALFPIALLLVLIPWPVGVISLVPIAIYMWICLAILAKRLHDRGRSAWFLLVFVSGAFGNPVSSSPAWYLLGSFVGIVAMFWLIIETYVLAGTPGPNRFGPPPAGTIVPPDGVAAPNPVPGLC